MPKDPLASLDANSAWVACLLELFRAVQAAHEGRALLPIAIEQAYETAEAARRRL